MMSDKVTSDRQLVVHEGSQGIFELRGCFVTLAARVAEVFNVETREIVQNITRNNEGSRPLFPERYAFQVNEQEKTTVRDELGNMAQETVSHIKEWLRSKKIGNEKIEAETCLLLEKARDMYERRQSELVSAALDQERKALENFEKKIDIVERLLAMHNQLEPNAVVGLVGQYVRQPLSLPARKQEPNKA